MTMIPPITLYAIQSKQAELAELIDQLQKQTLQSTQIEIAGCTIELLPGEHYAGAVLDTDGKHQYHLVLMAAQPTGKLNWQAAMDWAKRIGGELPNCQEQALLYTNCQPHLKTEWHWSSQTHEGDASCAWGCGFGLAHVCERMSLEGSAVAVRRV